ncbi:protein of unknown function [Methylocaldum szegediense]|uniref:TonB-dependent receptor-like beta-barrel domain-containing protein n=1 Tax=Methylocaldum szegediense TaxID=73780 RepID=A0ABN8X429_9GAMM|nr:protein of unknown function [Methylocaldum szegediense]
MSNLPNATIAGFEANAEYRFSEHWRGGGAYTYTDSRNLDNGRRVPFRPRNSVRIWGEWRAPFLPVIVWAEGVYRGLSYNDVGNTLDVNGAVRVNAHINYRLLPKFEVYLRGENLSNDRIPDAFSFDHPGAVVYGGVMLEL